MSLTTSAPRVVGRYAVFDPIASGGMASVHLGRLLGPVGFSRTVAIKRLHENFACDPEFVAMFLDEARIVTRVQHPNVVPTMDVVALEQELLIVMEYVSGETFSQLLKRAREQRKPPPIRLLVDIVISVLNGLHAAHEATSEQGEPLAIVHRDVSPQNILVGTDGVARVLDFGIAKAVGRMQNTHTGQVKGKLRYMAPEQIRGETITRAADIYSAGVVLWEALTATRLIGGGDSASVLRRVLELEPVAPSQLRSEVPHALDQIVLRALQKDSTQRYATAREMACALEEAIVPVTRSAVGDWVMELAGEALQRRRAAVLAVESERPTPEPSRPEPSRPVVVAGEETKAADASCEPTQAASVLLEPTRVVTPAPSSALDELTRVMPLEAAASDMAWPLPAASETPLARVRFGLAAAIGAAIAVLSVLFAFLLVDRPPPPARAMELSSEPAPQAVPARSARVLAPAAMHVSSTAVAARPSAPALPASPASVTTHVSAARASSALTLQPSAAAPALNRARQETRQDLRQETRQETRIDAATDSPQPTRIEPAPARLRSHGQRTRRAKGWNGWSKRISDPLYQRD